MKLEPNQAVVNGKSLSISTKMSIEMCRNILNKDLADAQRMIEDVVSMKRALPIKKFKRDLSHKKGGIGPGRYPINTSLEFLNLLNSVKKNAENKGLNADKLIISFAKADRSEKRYRHGRKGRTRAKNTNVSLVVTEKQTAEKEKK